jgi:hypothetical protein
VDFSYHVGNFINVFYDKIMKITIEYYGKTYSVETQNDDLSIDEHLQIIYGLLIQLTFNSEVIKNGLLDLAEEINNSEI